MGCCYSITELNEKDDLASIQRKVVGLIQSEMLNRLYLTMRMDWLKSFDSLLSITDHQERRVKIRLQSYFNLMWETGYLSNSFFENSKEHSKKR